MTSIFKFLLSLVVICVFGWGISVGLVRCSVKADTSKTADYFESGRDVSFTVDKNRRYLVESNSPINLSARSETSTFVIAHSDGTTIYGDTPEFGGFVSRNQPIENGTLTSREKVTVDLSADTLITVRAEIIKSETERYNESIAMVAIPVIILLAFFCLLVYAHINYWD